MRKHLALVALTVIALGAALFLPAVASAVATPKATGGVELSSPMQYVEFNAFDYGAAALDRGTISYTNFDLAAAGSGVWDVRGTYPLVFTFGGDYEHSLTVSSIKPTSSTTSSFEGTGFYVGGPATTWSIHGIVDGSTISFDLTYTAGPYVPYSLHAVGTINADGSMSGSSVDTLARTLPWRVPAGSVHEVYSYKAAVTCATVDGVKAAFSYVIPAGVAYSGTPVLFAMTDGGSPGSHDTLGFTTSFTGCDPDASVTNYPIVGGNLVVH